MVLFLIEIDLPDHSLANDLERVNVVLDSFHHHPGYCTHSINRYLHKENRILLIVEWADEAALKLFLQSLEFKLLNDTIKSIGKKYSSSFAGVLSHEGTDLFDKRIASP